MKTADQRVHGGAGATCKRPGRTRYGTGDRRPPGRWLTTLPAKTDVVRKALLGTLSDMRAPLAYLYEADDKVIVRATLGERQIRAELAPLEPGMTRILVVTLKDGDVDRPLSSRIVETVAAQLA